MAWTGPVVSMGRSRVVSIVSGKLSQVFEYNHQRVKNNFRQLGTFNDIKNTKQLNVLRGTSANGTKIVEWKFWRWGQGQFITRKCVSALEVYTAELATGWVMNLLSPECLKE